MLFAQVRQSVGYVGTSDGWQDFAANGRMTWTYAGTDAGNVAGISELVLDEGVAQLALAFGARPAPNATRATWRFSAPRPSMPAGRTLRPDLMARARLRFSLDGGQSWADLDARDTGLGVWVVDVTGSDGLAPGQAVDFTFWWPQADHWEGRDFRVEVIAADA